MDAHGSGTELDEGANALWLVVHPESPSLVLYNDAIQRMNDIA